MLEVTHKLIVNILKYPFYNGIPLFGFILEKLYKKESSLKDTIDGEISRFDQQTKDSIKNLRSKSLVSCFSKRNDSMLMWSHYAQSHRGVCLEFEEPADKNFKEVHYSNNKPKIKLYKLVSHILALDLVGQKAELKPELLSNFNDILSPWYSKSKEWSYEKEIRCVYQQDEQNSNLKTEDKYIVRKMDWPTAIYVGVKAEEEELEHLFSLAKTRDIPIYFMKEDESSFNIVIDKNKKAPISVVNP